MSKHTLTITRELAAPPDVVFDAWTTPEHMAAWMSPMPKGATVPKLELREGGEYRIDMHGEDRDFVHTGRYLKIDKPHVLEFTWISEGTEQKETVVRLELAAQNGGTLLTLTHSAMPTETAAQNHEKGWAVIVDKLAAALVKAAH